MISIIAKIIIRARRYYVPVLFVVVLVAIVYSPILNGFFQHDEWQAFASIDFLEKLGLSDIVLKSFSPKVSHYSPFTELIFTLLFQFFGLNYLGYAVISLVLHLFIVLLIFFLAYYLTKKLVIACMSALLFGLNASSYQAVSWMSANINTQGATIFGLICLIFFFYFLQKGAKRYSLFLICIILLVISLLFKEITIAFFTILPLILLFYTKDKIDKRRIIYCSIICGLGILYLSFRFSMFFVPSSDSKYIITKDQNFQEIIYNTLSFPEKIFAQSVIPTQQLLIVAKMITSFLPQQITGQAGTTEFDQFVENKVLQLLDFSIFFIAVVVVLFVWKRRTKEPLKKIILWSFVFTILSSFIYALSPGRNGSIPVIDSRNIYFPAIGTSIFIATIAYIIGHGKVIKIVFICSLIIFLHIYWINEQHNLRISTSLVRKNILLQIKREHYNLPEKVVFYIASDKAYYGMSEKIPPFETGLGQALLVWYHSTEGFPNDFFKDKFLRSLTDQGYREVNGRGFGYFRDISLLKKVVKQNNLLPESVISYNYFGDTDILQETTIQIREELRNIQKDYQ